ncbi:MAG: hypothetical protein N2C14_01005 [Planctomycetales bacterium]
MRSLVVLMFLASVGFGFHGRVKQKERAAVALRELGARFLYVYDTHKVSRSEREFIHAKDSMSLNAAVDPQRL